MPTVLPSDNQLTGFQCCHAWKSPEHTRREDSKFSGSQGPPQASGCMTISSLQNTMTAKEGDMGTRAYAVYMQFLWTAVGAGTKGVIKILQINYTKKKRQIIYIRNLYKAFTSPSSFVRTLQGGEGGGGETEMMRLGIQETGGNFKKNNFHTGVFLKWQNQTNPPTFIVDLSVAINVCFSDHLVHFLISQFLPQVCHHVA